jgi:hypothetical protein
LSSDDSVAATGPLFETFTIQDSYSSTDRLNQTAVLQLIGSLSDGSAACSEQMRQQFLGDA